MSWASLPPAVGLPAQNRTMASHPRDFGELFPRAIAHPPRPHLPHCHQSVVFPMPRSSGAVRGDAAACATPSVEPMQPRPEGLPRLGCPAVPTDQGWQWFLHTACWLGVKRRWLGRGLSRLGGDWLACPIRVNGHVTRAGARRLNVKEQVLLNLGGPSVAVTDGNGVRARAEQVSWVFLVSRFA